MAGRRDILKGALGLGAANLLGLGFTQRAFAAQNMNLALSWLYNTASAGELVAAAKGFYGDSGLNVSANPGGPSSNVIQELLGGQCDVAVAYAPQIMYGRNNGLPIKCFAAAFQKAPLAYYSLGPSNIKTIADWKGKRVGAAQSGLPQIQALLRLNGLSMDDIEFVQTGDVPALLQGQVDIIGTWTTSIGQNEPITSFKDGYNVQRLWDNGLQFQSNYYVARDETLQNKPELLVSFLEATDKGWSYAADNREETIDIILGLAPALDRALEAAALDMILDEYVFTEATLEHGFGDVSKEKWTNTLNTYAEMEFIDGKITVDDVFDGRILAAANVTKR